MQNKCGCGCNAGFVAADSNWDFNMHGDCGCQQNYNRNRRRSDGYDEARKSDHRARSNEDCQCERCDDDRQVASCDKNTYVRDMDACEDKYVRSRSGSCDENCQCDECTRNRNRARRSTGCEEGSNAYNRNRSGNAGCEKDCDDNGEAAYNRRRSDNCGCKNKDDNSSNYARSGKNRKVGMIHVERQEIDEIFESESALRAGTLFPELHKPMNGYCPYDGNCGTCKQAAAFAAWELRLYLNTHPHDKEALAIFRKLCKEAEEPNYATSFLTDDSCASGWNWVKNPWPWEYDCQCGD